MQPVNDNNPNSNVAIMTRKLNAWAKSEWIMEKVRQEQCQVCGDYHQGNVPHACETGDGE